MKKRGPGRLFLPGQSGNPGGRPKGLMAYIRGRTRDGEELADFMLDVLRGKPMPSAIRGQHGRVPRLGDRMEAAKWLADRGFGRVPLAPEDGVFQPEVIYIRCSDRDADDLGLPKNPPKR